MPRHRPTPDDLDEELRDRYGDVPEDVDDYPFDEEYDSGFFEFDLGKVYGDPEIADVYQQKRRGTMAMAMPDPVLRWDNEHTRAVELVYVQYDSPSAATYRVFGAAPSIRVCRACGCSRELCRCAWRRS